MMRNACHLLVFQYAQKKRTNKEPTGDVQDANEVKGW